MIEVTWEGKCAFVGHYFKWRINQRGALVSICGSGTVELYGTEE